MRYWAVLVLYAANVLIFTRALREFARPAGTPPGMRLVFSGGLITTLVTTGFLIQSPSSEWVQLGAMVVLATSLGLFQWAMQSARRHRFAIAFAGVIPEVLVTTGPYAWMSHPIYTAYALTWWAGALATARWEPSVLAAGMSALYIAAAVREDRDLGPLRRVPRQT